MHVIKMNNDKSLTTTINATIYQYEKNADTLIFLIPTKYEDKNIADCSVLMRYILPNDVGKSEELDMCPEPYKDYYKFGLKIDTAFTDVPGTIELWLNMVDNRDDFNLVTGSISVNIKSSKDITHYLSSEDRNQLNKISEKISKLEQQKADNIIYNNDESYLQLTANGSPIGNQVDMSKVKNDDVIQFDAQSEDADNEDKADEVIYF